MSMELECDRSPIMAETAAIRDPQQWSGPCKGDSHANLSFRMMSQFGIWEC
jgi:hypothetical protein